MLFHITITHSPQDCPGRRPTEPPALVAPSDTREALAIELGVKLHFVLWGASCMLWAQPEHQAFAVLETEDVESAMQYVSALVPKDWTCTALPVWNLPSQLRLVRQVRMAPPTQFGDAFAAAEPAPKAPPARAEVTPRRRLPQAEVKSDEPPIEVGDRVERSGNRPDTPKAPETKSPGTITLLLRELDAESAAPNESAAESASVGPGADRDQAQPPPTQIIGGAYEPHVTAGIWLVASAGPTKGKTFTVPPEGATIGRLPELQVYLPDERLSREHARIEFRDGRYWLLDLGSLNGTALNGTLVAEIQPLQSGDTIELGSSKLVVTLEPTGRS
jgi:FHA domain